MDNKIFWQRFARLYSPFMEKGNGRVYEDISAEITPRLHKNMKILELACGSGQLSFRLSDRVMYWIATDFSENMITEARKTAGPLSLSFEVQDATSLLYADGSFDAVVIANALHIMPEPDRAMGEIRRVLKPGGLLFAPTFVHGSGAGFLIRTKLLELIGFRVFSKWTTEEFTLYISKQGFNIMDSKQLGSSIAPLCCLTAMKQPNK